MTTSTTEFHKFTNRLAKEKSPYLLQHQHNPVEWFPWGKEAFDKAKSDDKLIFLSVGYSTCHWCHVMEHESFENEDIAKILNDHFVAIKVDREERPDVDKIYMSYVQASTGGGGWPMSVWLTPDLKPVVAGTYYPPVSKYGQPGFPDILRRIQSLWKTRRDDLVESANDVIEQLKNSPMIMEDGEKDEDSFAPNSPLRSQVFKNYFNIVAASYDTRLGGFSKAPKFPRPVVMTGLFHYHLFTKDISSEQALLMVEHTLREMYKGGMYDHLAGGFHRYRR